MSTSPPSPLPLIPWSKNPNFQTCDSLDATQAITLAAVDILVLGFPKQANKLLRTTWESGHILAFAPTAIFPLHRFWEVTNSFPHYLEWADEESVPEFFTGYNLSKEGGRQAWEKFRDGKEGRAWWPANLRNQSSEFGNEDLQYALERLGTGGEKEKHCTVGFAIDVAIEVGDVEKARDLVEKHVTGVYKRLRDLWDDETVDYEELRKELDERLGFDHALHVWSCLEGGVVGRLLDVQEKSVEAYVEEGCRLIRDRLTAGVQSLYTDKSVPELVKMMDESFVKARKLDPEGGRFMAAIGDDERKDVAQRTTFFRPPATDEQIQKLEEKLAHPDDKGEEIGNTGQPVRLPDDYKDFLHTTNGYYISDADPNELKVFFESSAVSRDFSDVLPDILTFILPSFHNLPFEDFEFIDMPDLNAKRFHIGAGGDEGYIFLIEPPFAQQVVERFDAAYAKADQRRRYVYDKLAVDAFGGIEKLRRAEWLCVHWSEWSPQPEICLGFKDFMERWAVPAAVEELRDAEAKHGK
ncbi:hypothetical protein P154DRAFT_625377 [Amniculicola lignicola CBS 123094]|uniref:Knr4/Smi1-like domain-containing protein n=1 Tax=Amniculicola lignicola CBS 123094 TaxID=1392246 RepID=A0A6A5VXT7_9PLEO|nr:hypothetical protein P154DRAFT_625377 [Amniculicola lignicola CBS 123094]